MDERAFVPADDDFRMELTAAEFARHKALFEAVQTHMLLLRPEAEVAAMLADGRARLDADGSPHVVLTDSAVLDKLRGVLHEANRNRRRADMGLSPIFGDGP